MGGIQVDAMERVRQRLAEWGHWQQSLADVGARGYAGRANFVQGSGGGGEYVCNPAAEEVEKILCQLKQHSPKVVNVLHQHYARQAANEMGAARCKMSVKTFKVYREKGEYYVLARLGG